MSQMEGRKIEQAWLELTVAQRNVLDYQIAKKDHYHTVVDVLGINSSLVEAEVKADIILEEVKREVVKQMGTEGFSDLLVLLLSDDIVPIYSAAFDLSKLLRRKDYKYGVALASMPALALGGFHELRDIVLPRANVWIREEGYEPIPLPAPDRILMGTEHPNPSLMIKEFIQGLEIDPPPSS